MNGIIYLIECVKDYDVEYKIGYSKNEQSLKNRLKALQTGNPGKLKIINKFHTNFNRKVETILHTTYSYKKMEGEWFRLDLNDVISFHDKCIQIENNLRILNEMKNPFLNK